VDVFDPDADYADRDVPHMARTSAADVGAAGGATLASCARAALPDAL
jgi:hypothetical protein